MTATEVDGAGLLVNLSVQVGRLADELESRRQKDQDAFEGMHLISVVLPQITAASQTISYGDLMGPMTGKVWDIRSITCATFTGGTVSLYRAQSSAGATDTQLKYVFQQAGTLWFARAQFLLQGNDQFILTASSSLTGSVTPSFEATEMDIDLLPDYLVGGYR